MNTVSSKLWLGLLISLLWGLSASAQSPVPYQSTGLPNTIYSGGNVDNVDTTSGNLRITIPLVHLPGRGLDTDIVLSYNSKIWIMNESIDPNTGFSIYQAEMDADSFSNVAPGWGVGVPRMGRYGNYSQVCQLYGEFGCMQWVDYVDWVMTDGTRVFMQDDLGKYSSCTAGTWSYDGTYIRFPVTPGACLFYNRAGRYKDGVKVVLPPYSGPPGPQTLTDTNGNFISCGPGPSCTDTLGRIITYNYEQLPPPYPPTYTRLASITYKDSSGALQAITFGHENVTSYYPVTWLSGGLYTSQANSCPPGADCYRIYMNDLPPPLLTSVTLPNGKSYQFEYLPNMDTDAAGASTALLSKIILPTGGYIRYTYTNGGTWAHYTAIASRVVSSDGAAASEKTSTYVVGGGVPSSVSQVTDPLGNIQVIQFDSHGWAPATITFKNPAGTALKTITRTTGCDETAYNNADANVAWKCSNPRVLTETTTLNDTNKQSKVTYTYGTRGNVTAKSEYDWGTAAPGPLVRTTTFTYLHDSNTAYAGTSVHILDRVLTQNVCNSGATFCGKKSFVYDGTAPSPTSNVVGHDYAAFPATYNLRGNPTQVKVWRNTTSSWLTTTNVFNDVGNLLQSTDPGSHITSFSYTDNYYNYTPPQPTLAFVTQVTKPMTGSVNHLEKSQYYFYSGLPAARCGENYAPATCAFAPPAGQSDFTTHAYDLLNRPVATTKGDGGQKTTCYSDTPGASCYSASLPINIVGTTKINATTNLATTATYDGLGRLKNTTLTSDPQGAVYTRTDYDALGRRPFAWNPTRCDLTVDPPPTSCAGEPTFGKTESQFDPLGRITKLIPPDGSSSSNNVTTTYSGNCTTVTDQAGKVRKSCTDGLGRLVQVFEPNSSGSLIYETDYQYDVLDNLTRVDQKGNDANSANWRTRTFTYNSLSQLLTASNPESGTINYTYDADGNLLTKVAPAPNQTGTATVATNYQYDALHRLTLKTYSDATPGVVYTYDVANPFGLTTTNPIGRLVAEWTGVSGQWSSWKAFGYDAVGRVTMLSSCLPLPVDCANSIATLQYDLAGDLISETNLPFVTLTRTYNAAGRPAQVTSNWADAQHPATLFTADPGIGYYPHGALRKAALGNGLTLTNVYNNRLQPCLIDVNSSNITLQTCADSTPPGNVLDFYYGYNEGVSNNGNVILWNATGVQTSFRSFGYDSLNRLQSMTDSAAAQACKGLSWSYDIWGNRTDQNVTAGSCGQFHATVNAQNRLVGPPYQYDAAGNLTFDGSHSYTYDAENRITQVDAGATASYIYDPEGRRTQKTVSSTAMQYLYDLGGQVIGEKNSSGVWLRGYVYLGGSLLAQYANSTTYFVHKDHLGSTRLLTGVGQSQVSNGGFEQGLTGWSPYNAVLVTDATRAHSGSNYMQLSAPAGGGASVASPDVAVQPGDQITFGGWVYLESGGGGALGWWLAVQDASRTAIAYIGTPNPTSPGWTYQSATYTVPANGAFVAPYAQIYLPSLATVLRVDDGFLYNSRLSLTIVDNLDYLPFGEQIAGGTAITHKFTGKERDGESSFDFFGARYYASNLGRFTSPDEPFADQTESDPQSWNLYSYVRNNPLGFTDPNGEACVMKKDGSYEDDESGGQSCAEAAEADKKTNPSAIVTPDSDELRLMMLQSLGENLSSPGQWADISRHGLEGANPIVGAISDCVQGNCGAEQGLALIPFVRFGKLGKIFINAQKQARHLSGTAKAGRSILTENPAKLLAEFAGKGRQIKDKSGNVVSTKEIFDAGRVIGTYVDRAGNAVPTTKATIHYSNTGAHIVPAHP